MLLSQTRISKFEIKEQTKFTLKASFKM